MSSHTPRKRFGQNFLHDPQVITQIIHAIAPASDQTLVEIGPGQGALTEHLLGNCQHLHVVEIDRDLAAALQAQYADHRDFSLHNADALKFDFCSLANQHKLRLIGNLPYNISTPLLFHILKNAECIEDMHFMLQKEVIDRMAASPGNKAYGRLTVMIQYHCEVEPLFHVGPGAFNPPPKVDSAVVRLLPHHDKPYIAQDYGRFEKMVNQAFSLRRKTLRNALKAYLTEKQIKDCGIDPTLRPEMLTVEDYINLSNYQ